MEANVSVGTRILAFCSRTRWQLVISALAGLLGSYLSQHSRTNPALTGIGDYVAWLAVTGAILAIAASISFGQVMYFIGDASRRKEDAYYRLWERLKHLQEFADHVQPRSAFRREVYELTEDLRGFRLEDYPITDWDKRVAGVIEALDRGALTDVDRKNAGERSVDEREFLVRLVQCEALINIIGLMSIRQIVATVVIGTFTKSFVALAALLVCGVVSLFMPGDIGIATRVGITVLFVALTALIFIEIAWGIHREGDEMLDFIEKE